MPSLLPKKVADELKQQSAKACEPSPSGQTYVFQFHPDKQITLADLDEHILRVVKKALRSGMK